MRHLLEKRLRTGLGAQVGSDADDARLRQALAHYFEGFVDPGLGATVEDHFGPRLGQADGDGQADAGGGAADDGALAVQGNVHLCLLGNQDNCRGCFAAHRDTRPLLHADAISCRSGLVSRWAAKRPQNITLSSQAARQTPASHHPGPCTAPPAPATPPQNCRSTAPRWPAKPPAPSVH